jgi:hypothetical protein
LDERLTNRLLSLIGPGNRSATLPDTEGFVTKPALDATSFDEELKLEPQRAGSYRTTADRYRRMLDEATTPALTQYFSEMIAKLETLAREGEARVTGPLQLARDVAERATEICTDQREGRNGCHRHQRGDQRIFDSRDRTLVSKSRKIV